MKWGVQELKSVSSTVHIPAMIVNTLKMQESYVLLTVRLPSQVLLLFYHVYFILVCENGTVHLVDGQTRFEGRIEVCFGGVWGSVCSEDWEQNTVAAVVICKQLGIYSSLGTFLLSSTSSEV